MVWHPGVLRDPALSGSSACWTVGCDAGRPSGLALLRVSSVGEVHAASATLRFGAHPTPSKHVVMEVEGALMAALAMEPSACRGSQRFLPGDDPRGEWWEYAGEAGGDVHERAGTDHAQAQGKRRSLQKTTRLEGQIAAAVAMTVALRGEATYPAEVWRQIIRAQGAKTELAKALAVGFIERQFAAVVSDHEAEAICIALFHIRTLRMGERRAQSPLLPEEPKGKGRRELPQAVLDAAAREPVR